MKRLTRRGAIALASGALALASGAALGSWLLAAPGLAALVALGLAWLERGAARVAVARGIERAILHEGGRSRVELRIDAARGRWARVRDGVPAGLDVVEGENERALRLPGALSYTLEAATPGRWSLGPAEIAFSDALGLVEDRVTLGEDSSVVVYPDVAALKGVSARSRMSLPLAGPHATGQAGPGADFYALRSYQEGDTMRDVNWRASARNAKGLVVNQREKESQAFVTFFLDASATMGVGTARENAWVESARAFASLAAHFARRRDRPRLVIYGEGVQGPIALRSGDTTLASVLDPLLDSPASGSTGLAHAVALALPALRPNAPVILVSSFLGDDSVAAAVASMRALGQHVTALAIGPRAHLEASGTDPAAIEKALAARARRLDEMRANGAHVVAWEAGEPLVAALAREAML